jgi:hypothetical protein
VHVAKAFEAAVDAPEDASVLPLLVSCVDARGKKFSAMMNDDFDRAGMRIAHWLSHDSPKYRYATTPDVVDIGLRLADVKRMKLASEGVTYRQGKDPGDNLRDCDDVTREEVDFLVQSSHVNPLTGKLQWTGRRVELNAMTSRQFVEFLKRKIEENGVKKVVPVRDILKIAWRRAQKIKVVNAAIAVAVAEIDDDWNCPAAPQNLATQVREMLRRNPRMPWDDALARIAAKRGR